MIGEKIDKIQNVVAHNGLVTHRNFNSDYISRHSYYTATEALASSIADDMTAICTAGVNCGFTSSMKAAIEKLSAIVVGLTEVSAADAKLYERYANQRQKILDSVSPIQTAFPLDARAPIEKYVASSIKGVNTLISLSDLGEEYCRVDAIQKKYMGESLSRFEEIEEKLASLVDVSSVTAADYAAKIVKLIDMWRVDFSEMMCTSETVRNLDEAIYLIEQWAQCVTAVGKRDRAKSSSLPEYVSDEVEQLGDCVGIIEKLQVFKARMDDKSKDLEKERKSLQDLEEERNKAGDELQEIKKAEALVVAEYKNTGDMVKANRSASKLAQRKKVVTARYNEITKRISSKTSDVVANEKIFSQIASVYEKIMEHNSDPAMLCIMTNGVDLNTLARMFRGAFDQTTVTKAVEDIFRINASVDELRKQRSALISNFVDMNEIMEETLTGVRELDEVIGEKEVEIADSGKVMNDDLLKLLNAHGGAEGETAENETEAIDNLIIPLDDEDK